ncbi:hypothetical protein CVS40_12656 [Lucilia cuprina]|nr:hypothetical protein CVS40_12656 [Lucilia cuprina]
MASSSGGNYFQLLDPDPSPKRKKSNFNYNINNNFDFPKITQKQTTSTINKQQCPKYIVIRSKIPDKPLQNFNIFLLSKAIENISSEPMQKIVFTKDGNILILSKNEIQANKFLKTNTLNGIGPVEIFLHPTLNIIKGVVFAPSLKELSEQEITDGLKNQGVVDCKKITKFIEGKVTNTPLHILHFDQYRLPKEIKIGFLNCKVDPYIPTPIQCKKCFKLGHTKKYCNGNETCEICSSTIHDPTPCTKLECVNCKHPHRANNKKCPVIQYRQEILKQKTINNCTYKEATTKALPVESFEIPSEDLQTAIEERKKKLNIQKNNNQQQQITTILPASTTNETSSNPTTTKSDLTTTAIKSLEEIISKNKALKNKTLDECKTSSSHQTQISNTINKKSANNSKTVSRESSREKTEKLKVNTETPAKITNRRLSIDGNDQMET